MEIPTGLKCAKRYVDGLSPTEMSRVVKIYKISNLNPRIGLKWMYMDAWSIVNKIEHD